VAKRITWLVPTWFGIAPLPQLAKV